MRSEITIFHQELWLLISELVTKAALRSYSSEFLEEFPKAIEQWYDRHIHAFRLTYWEFMRLQRSSQGRFLVEIR
jgi:hypothetical protein